MNNYLKQIQADVDEMNRVFEGGGDVKTDPPSTDPPEVKTDPPSTDPPEMETDPPSTDEPRTDSPKTEPPTTDAPDDKDKIIEELRRELEERKRPKTEPPKTKAPTTTAPIEDLDFLGDMDFEDLTKEDFNKILNDVYKKGVSVNASPDVLASLPNLLTTVVTLKEASTQFYKDNEDLVPYRKTVADSFEELVKANPDKNFTELFDDVAVKAREKLKLPAPQKKTIDKGNPPKLPRKKGKSGRSKEPPKPNETQSQIDEMNKTLTGR